MSPNPQSSEPGEELAQHRSKAIVWGVLVLIIVCILGALVAPHTTLLAVALLVGLGAAGLIVNYGTRLIGNLFKSPDDK